MKTLNFILTLVIIALLGSCSTSRIAGPGVYDDDLYYVPGKTSSAQVQFTEVPTLDKDAKKAYNRDFNEQVREYERSDRARNQQDERDFTEIQREYAGILGNDTITEVDTLLYYNDETGYWVDGFEGSEMDRDYAERIIRFHGPFRGIPYWSPLYTEVVYMNNWGWNVYVDGNYAYVFPSWSNPWYYSYSPRWSMSMNWGWGSWGYGYPYYSYGYYGYYSPWYGWGYDPWYYPYHHHYAHHNHGYYGNSNYNYAPRQSYSNYSGVNPSGVEGNTGVRPNRRVLDSNAENLKAGANDGVTGRPARSSAYSNPQSPSGQPNVNRRPNVGENKSATDRPTRSSYVPRYSESSSPTRPQYNSQGYTRPSGSVQNSGTQGNSAPRREYSQPAKSGNSSGYTRPASTSPSRGTGVTSAPSRPTQSSGSSSPARSSGSSGSSERYSPSSSSGSGSSHTPSSSSSSGSSGSSSGSSSRSSGTPRR